VSTAARYCSLYVRDKGIAEPTSLPKKFLRSLRKVLKSFYFSWVAKSGKHDADNGLGVFDNNNNFAAITEQLCRCSVHCCLLPVRAGGSRQRRKRSRTLRVLQEKGQADVDVVHHRAGDC